MHAQAEPLHKLVPVTSHWGNYLAEVAGDRLVAIHPYATDPDPTPIGQSLLNAQDEDVRVLQPMIRQGYLEQRHNSDGARRGIDPFVPVAWDTALDMAADAIQRVRQEFGNEAIYGGSYGWASAGRFHHATSQVHRFLNTAGGYTRSVNSYSVAAAEVIMTHVLGTNFYDLMMQAPTVEDITKHTRLVVCFGGIAMKNTQIMAGGLGAHTAKDQLQGLKQAGVRFVNVSPVKDDMADYLDAEWWPCRPNSDVAVMLGIAHTLVANKLQDKRFLDTYCTGFERFLPYLMGAEDGIVKDAGWAAQLAGIPAEKIEEAAKQMAAERCLIGISWSLQRSEFGEQSYWMATLLSAMLGYVGLPGAGVAYGYGSVHNIGFAGRRLPNYKTAALPQGENAVTAFIPVARISDMLLNPGEQFEYNGQTLTYPDIRLVYWAGGNPFHHHQDLNRLRRAWARPETIVVNEPFWTATARHADIVFPSTTALERNDICINPYDCHLAPMPSALPPLGQSKNDYDIFAGLAQRLGSEQEFTEGRDEMDWVRHLYGKTREAAAGLHVSLPEFDDFWHGRQITVEEQIPDRVYILEKFRTDPEINPLRTPSGRIELYSEKIAGFNYDDCAGHPRWYDRQEWLGAGRAAVYPLHLISNQPKTRLHSQYDHGVTSRNAKLKGRAPARMNPDDAAERDIRDGDIIRLFNDRGACLAGVILTENLRPGVIELETGAWYDPQDPGDPMSLEVHGNPNALTRDAGTSKLAQGPSAHSCLVEVEKFTGELPEIRVFSQPATISRS
ncbi:MAG: molybdopterin-dependent oxidoreductase [Gammaproteobacteria bacterium]|nr:molybdopterin-dependent oxidoreductase [Gammaproteobacteria bacterium]